MMRKSIFGFGAAFLASSSAFAHDSVVAHAHPHGIDAVLVAMAAGGLLGIFWHLGLPPFEAKAVREIQKSDRR